ncbi:MAG: hypothetical protein QOI57_2198, partial [Rubrobacteraceae bacterium]|nr:hypothetical protein [Rubrobacteraceae bacterium]
RNHRITQGSVYESYYPTDMLSGVIEVLQQSENRPNGSDQKDYEPHEARLCFELRQ